MKHLYLCLLAVTLIYGSVPSIRRAEAEPDPARVILLIIDGLRWDAPQRLQMTNLLALAEQGAVIEKAWLVMPNHPVTGAWAELHTCSYPNPVLMAGTLFITPQTRYLQHSFNRRQNTAHAANCLAYLSLNRDYTYSMLKNAPDAAAIDFTINLIESNPISFMRIHLQNTGSAGYQCSRSKPDTPGYRDIWADGSPYVKAALEADRQLGRLMSALQASRKWDDTLLVITADHGQADTGWHPTMAEDSWCAPLIFVGPGIRPCARLAEAEHIDVVPTICRLMDIEPPNNDAGAGRVLHEIMAVPPDNVTPASAMPVTRAINQTIKEYMLLRSEMLLRAAQADPHLENAVMLADRRFYGIDRLLDWHKAGSPDKLLQTNRKILKQLQAALEDSQKNREKDETGTE